MGNKYPVRTAEVECGGKRKLQAGRGVPRGLGAAVSTRASLPPYEKYKRFLLELIEWS